MFQDLSAFRSALRTHRTRAGLTQRQLAESAGVSIRTVRAIEGGHVKRPHIASLRLLASVVGLDDKPAAPAAAAFRIEILGPLSIRNGDTPLHAGPVKQRGLLALLGLHADHVVPQSEIVDVLWGDEPPATYRELIYASISRLRKVLRHGSARIDVTSGSGYRLRIAPGELDLLRFDELAARGALAEALDCWRGSILADMDVQVTGRGNTWRVHEAHVFCWQVPR